MSFAPLAGVAIRRARPADAWTIAEINVLGWRHAYAGIMPSDFLASLTVESRAEGLDERFAQQLAEGDANGLRTRATLLAEDGAGGVLGYVACGPYRVAESGTPAPPAQGGLGWGEIYALYVHPERHSLGVGRALMAAALARFAPGTPVGLWVLTENAPARRFYARQGFLPDGGTHVFEVAGVSVPELRYAVADAARGGATP